MTNREMILLIGLVVSASTAIGLGVQVMKPMPYGGFHHRSDWRERMEKFHQKMMTDADADHDGFLTEDEMLSAHKKRLDEMFKELDANHDGKLSPTELAKGRELMRAKMMKRFAEERNAPTDQPAEPAPDAAR